MSGFEKFKERLPSKAKSYNPLTGKKISDKVHELITKDWDKFENKTMKDHHNLYLKYHVLLLADVFEKFRNSCLKSYGLCPGHYLGAPDLSWYTMLDMTKV